MKKKRNLITKWEIDGLFASILNFPVCEDVAEKLVKKKLAEYKYDLGVRMVTDSDIKPTKQGKEIIDKLYLYANNILRSKK